MSASSPHVLRGRRRPDRVTHALWMDVACSLTDRDRQILRLIHRHRVLAASQLKAMFFTDPNTARHRLTRLHRHRLVDRFRLPAAVAADLHPGRPAITETGFVRSTEYAYVLDTVGAQILADEHTTPGGDLGREGRRVRWRTEQALSIAASPRLAHTLGANQVFADLTAAARRLPDASLEAWWGEAWCRPRFGGLVNPDGLGVWAQDGGRLPFALEYDRGTETLATLARKLDDYLHLEQVLGWEQWLLIVVPGPRREQGARARLAGTPAGRHCQPRPRVRPGSSRLGAHTRQPGGRAPTADRPSRLAPPRRLPATHRRRPRPLPAPSQQ